MLEDARCTPKRWDLYWTHSRAPNQQLLYPAGSRTERSVPDTTAASTETTSIVTFPSPESTNISGAVVDCHFMPLLCQPLNTIEALMVATMPQTLFCARVQALSAQIRAALPEKNRVSRLLELVVLQLFRTATPPSTKSL